jgi:hypothetical protein
MATVNSKSVQDRLEDIKKNISDFRQYFEKNYSRFNRMRKLVFETTLSDADISLLQLLQRPQIEFNILESYLSQQRSQYAKQEPSLEVRNADCIMQPVDESLVNMVESHMRCIIFDSNQDNTLWDIFTDAASGGFGVMKVTTEYANEMSFDQNICFKRAYDPTLCGFDKTAVESHKGDGRYCFELFPMEKSVFESKYGKEYTEKMDFNRSIGGYNWCYEIDNKKIVLVADYYEKQIKKVKIVKLATNDVMTAEDYQQFVQEWNKVEIIMPPAIVASRISEIETITRYRLIGDAILEYDETDFKYLPLIFFDGNSAMLRNGDNGSAYQLTRPLIYNAEGIQKLKNWSGITLANELENTVQHKIMACQEGIPPQYEDAYIDVQQPSTLIYNAYREDGVTQLPPPQMIARTQIPPEISNTFMMSDQMTQAILGTYDAALANNNQLSGEAILNGSIQSNGAAYPYIVNNMKGLNRLAEILIDLFPKYYKTPRTIPIKDATGKRQYVMINTQDGPKIEYDSKALQVKVTAGVNFEMQQQQALNSLVKLMQVSPVLSQFIGSEEAGIEMLLDNLNIRGVDSLKQGVSSFIERMKQQQAEQQKMQQQQAMMATQNDPMQLAKQELKQRAEKNMVESQLKAAQLNIDKQDSDTNRMLTMAKIGEMMSNEELEKEKIQAENARTVLSEVVKNVINSSG